MVKEKNKQAQARAESEFRKLVLYNDDVNTFDYVIDCLIEICNHEPEQAEQCAMLVHYRGQCVIQSGEELDLAPACTALNDRGLSSDIL